MDCNPFIPPLAVFLTMLGALVIAIALLAMQLDAFVNSVAASAETPSVVTRAF